MADFPPGSVDFIARVIPLQISLKLINMIYCR